MIAPPLIHDDALEYWRYMNRCNPDGTRTPLSRPDVTRLFAYVQLLEERLKELGSGFDDLREFLGLGKGVDGAGIPSRAEVRRRLRALQRRRDEQSVQRQREGSLGTLPLYTARFQAANGGAYVASIDEMPGVYGQGPSLSVCMASLAEVTRGTVSSARNAADGRPRAAARSARR
jgi:predicted RNase H-like HicB family nuclease